METGKSKSENGKARKDNSKTENRNPKSENVEAKMGDGNQQMETGNSKARSSGLTAVSPIKDFKDLEVWKAARGLRHEMYKLAKGLPDTEKFGLATQIRRASISITANIAEGYGRFGYQENIQFCRQARASVYELRDYLTTCADEDYIALTEARRLEAEALRVVRLINGYLRSTMFRKAQAEK